MGSAQKCKCLVTGGSGFLGRHLVSQLLASGEYDVSVFDLRPMTDRPEPVSMIVGDLTKPHHVNEACKGMSIVFHCATAAPVDQGLNQKLMYAVNVAGTTNVINACINSGVSVLVYTSSASVVYEGRDLIGVDESAPYAVRPMDYYTQTKVLGEKLVLEANGRGGLATVALRPSGIFGEGDPLLVPKLISRARAGKMKFIVGNGTSLMDWTYVGNVAQAHLEVAEALSSAGSPAAGQAYFITNGEKRTFWGFLGDILEGLGYDRPSVKLPFWLIFTLAFIFETLIVPLLRLLRFKIDSDFNTVRITLSCCNRNFKVGKAERDFGYKPKVSIDEGLERTLAYFADLRAPQKGKKVD